MRRKIGKPLRDKRGFTLIESVLGVLLFALVMTVVAA
ncbi:type II secretion system protein, partial [Anaerotruncus massiliensis (ex Liu et al. 2021)]